MGRAVVKIKDRYFEWSSIVDAPISYGMTFEQLMGYYRYQYGQSGVEGLERDRAKLEETGTTYRRHTAEEVIDMNRAGENEEKLTADEIYERFRGEVEMIADWMAAASVKDQKIDLDYLQDRFGLSDQLRSIIWNTLNAADMDATSMNIPHEYEQRHNFAE
jgi:hypothetical protein